MKIALLTDRFCVGGGLEYIFQVARGLAQHEFVVLARGGLPPPKLSALPNVTLDGSGFGRAMVARHRVDLIHINHLRPLVAHGFVRRPLCPTINTVHGLHLRRYDFSRRPSDWALRAMRRWLEARCLRNVDLNIALTESDKEYLFDQLAVTNVEVIPNGIEAAAGARRVKQALAADARGVCFLVVARFVMQKGYDVLLHAIGKIQPEARRRAFRFVFVGDGPLRKQMEQRATSLGILDLIEFAGETSDVGSRFEAADAVILPSRWEGLPFVLLEAGRAGCDVICSDAAGNRDVVNAPHLGMTFRNEDAADLASKLIAYGDGKGRGTGEKLRDRAIATFSLTTMLERLESVYIRTARQPRSH